MKRILLIEEDTDAREMMVFMFENNGYDVVSTGKETSIEEISKINPNIIIVDYQLGNTPGNDICIKLKSNELTAATPIIMYSANSTVEKIAVGSRADAHVAKPFELDDFVWLVSRMAL
jgi:DNA-binding response OmpR family regulator